MSFQTIFSQFSKISALIYVSYKDEDNIGLFAEKETV